MDMKVQEIVNLMKVASNKFIELDEEALISKLERLVNHSMFGPRVDQLNMLLKDKETMVDIASVNIANAEDFDSIIREILVSIDRNNSPYVLMDLINAVSSMPTAMTSQLEEEFI